MAQNTPGVDRLLPFISVDEGKEEEEALKMAKELLKEKKTQ